MLGGGSSLSGTGSAHRAGLAGSATNAAAAAIAQIISEAQSGYSQELSYVMAMGRQQHTRDILAKTVVSQPKSDKGFAERLSRITIHPITGIPILIAGGNLWQSYYYLFYGALGTRFNLVGSEISKSTGSASKTR